MKKLFDLDRPFAQALSIAFDLLMMNLLTLLCCVPVITAGAGLTAMNDLIVHLVRNEDSYIVKPFFRSFRTNFRKSTILWLMYLAAGFLLYFDYHAAAVYMPVLRYPVAAIGVIVLAIGMYTFALLSRYENTVSGTLKNAVSLVIAFFPRTLGMVVFAVAFWVLSIHFYFIGVPLLLMFGWTLPCYVSALLLKDVFAAIEEKGRNPSD